MKLIQPFPVAVFTYTFIDMIILLNLSTFVAFRERFACEERLNNNQCSQRLVTGNLMACSSHSYEAEVAHVLYNVSAHLSSILCSVGVTYHYKRHTLTKKKASTHDIILPKFIGSLKQ
jgi:hypothetical protein